MNKIKNDRKFVFLDRDGTIILDKHYLSDPNLIEFMPGAINGLLKLQQNNFSLLVVTNQSGIARGYFDLDAYNQVNERFEYLLAQEGIVLEAVYYCPHHPDDGCNCRKPRPGMALKAAKEHNIDFSHAFVLGDKSSDIGLAKQIGAKGILLSDGVNYSEPSATFVATNFTDAVGFIINYKF